MEIQTRSQAIKMFGGSQVRLASALGITKAYVNKWPEMLTTKQRDWVTGAAIRLGVIHLQQEHDSNLEKQTSNSESKPELC